MVVARCAALVSAVRVSRFAVPVCPVASPIITTFTSSEVVRQESVTGLPGAMAGDGWGWRWPLGMAGDGRGK